MEFLKEHKVHEDHVAVLNEFMISYKEVIFNSKNVFDDNVNNINSGMQVHPADEPQIGRNARPGSHY